VLAVPATAAALAYLNARWRISPDLGVLRAIIGAKRNFLKREKADRVNSFYLLEEYANNWHTADKPFLVYEGKSWTFKQTHSIVLRYAGYLKSRHSVVRGEIVAIDFMNCPQFLFLTFAIWSLGATPAFINYNLTSTPFVHCVRVSTARLLIVDPEIEAKVLTPETRAALTSSSFGDNASPVGIAVLTPGLQSSLEYFPPYRAPDSARSGDAARSPSVLIFTSGTTGMPKAAIVPWERCVFGSDLVARWLGLRPVTSRNPDRYYTSMPLYHSSAFMLGFHSCLVRGVTLILGHKFSVSNFWEEVRASDATVIQYVGETLRYLMSNPPQPDDRTKHRVRMAFGNGLRPDVWDRFKSRFGIETIAEFYGATESVSASFNLSRNSFSSGAIGAYGLLGELVLASLQAIVRLDWETERPWRNPKTGLCEKVPRGEVGELLNPVERADIGAKFQGYFGNQEATDGKILLDVLKKGDAWYRTGDLVRWDKEGRLWFIDRIGDTFRWRSENVSTAEVGQVLGNHPRVLEANVYGVEIPSHEGRAGCAAVLLRDVPSDGEVPADLLESLAIHNLNGLPKYAVPLFIRVVSQIMTTGNNKQQKHVLRKEGVDPQLVGNDNIFWLRPGLLRYESFGPGEWNLLLGGKVKL